MNREIRNEHDANRALAGCKGGSCRQGRAACREGCAVGFALSEMACYHDDAEERRKGEAQAMWCVVLLLACLFLVVASGAYVISTLAN